MWIYLIGAALLLTAGIVAAAHMALIWLLADGEEASCRSPVPAVSRGNGLWRAFTAWRRSKPPLIADQRSTDRRGRR